MKNHGDSLLNLFRDYEIDNRQIIGGFTIVGWSIVGGITSHDLLLDSGDTMCGVGSFDDDCNSKADMLPVTNIPQ